MANPWFRFYSEFANDPKVQLMSEAMQRRLAMIMCLRCAEQLGSDKQIAWSLRISPSEAEETKQLFIENGFIDESWNLVHWDERQFSSDSSYQRVKKYRDKRQAAGLSRGSSHLQDQSLYDRDCNCCIYCGSREKLCIDHIFPISQGGTDDLDNLGVACKGCNSGKAGKTPEQSNLHIMTKSAQDRYGRYVTVTLRKSNGDSHAIEQNREEQNKADQKQKTPAPKSAFVLPESIPEIEWNAWLEVRRKKRASPTDHAMQLAVNKLIALQARGFPPKEVLNEAILRNWTGIFEPNERSNGGSNGHYETKQEANLRKALEIAARDDAQQTSDRPPSFRLA